MDFYLEVKTDLGKDHCQELINFLQKIDKQQDSINSLTLDLSLEYQNIEKLLVSLESFVESLSSKVPPLYILTIRFNDDVFSQLEISRLKQIFSFLPIETEVTIELMKYVDNNTDDSLLKVLDTIHGLRKNATRKFEIDVSYAPLMKETFTLAPVKLFLRTLEVSSALGVNTLINYVSRDKNPNIIEQIEYWRDFFSNKFNQNFMYNVLIPSFESRRNELLCCYLYLTKNEVSLQHCIYNRFSKDQPIATSLPMLSRDLIISQIEKREREQFAYAAKTKECSECHHLKRCVEGETLNFMKDHGLTNCQYPSNIVKALSR